MGSLWVPAGYRAAGYDGAKSTRRRDRKARYESKAQDEDRLIGPYDRETLRLECLHLRRNNAVVAGICQRFADHVVGSEGIRPQAKTTDPRWNELAEQFWGEWSKIIDYRRRLTMRETQRLVVQGRLHSGETAHLLTDTGQQQPIEAERIATPDDKQKDQAVLDGIKYDAKGRPSEYYICDRGASGYVDRHKYVTVPAQNLIHVYCPIRFDQGRGLPELAPVINTLADHGDLTEQVLLKARLDARHGWAIKTAEGAGKIDELGPRDVTGEDDTTGQKYESFDSPGTYYLRTGESVESLASNTPSANYVAHNELLLKLIGAAVGVPHQFLMLDYSSGTYGTNRVALMQTYRTMEGWQSWLVGWYLQRTWNWRIAKAINDGDLPPAPIDSRGFSTWYRVDWTPPEYSWIDPNKEADADISNWRLSTASITSLARKRGRDGEDMLREKAVDIATAVRVAREVNEAEGTALTWRDIIDVAMPGQTAPSQPQGVPPDEV